MIDLSGKKILLVRNDNIGDLTCTTPAIEALRKKYPTSKIDIVVNSYNYCAIDKNPFVDKIYCYTKPKHKKTFKEKLLAGYEKLKILLEIRREKYDVVVIFRSSYSKSAELFSNITNAKYKVGVKDKNNKDNLSLHINFNDSMHEVDFCYECIKPFGVLKSNENTIFHVSNELISKHTKYKDYMAFHISARMKNNQIEYEKLLMILNLINFKNIIITAEPKDYELAQKLSLETNYEFAKTNSFLDLAGLFKNLRLLLTLEGGAMHLSPALGVKTIALFGVSPIDRWAPWGYKDLVIQDKTKIANNIDLNLIKNKVEGCL